MDINRDRPESQALIYPAVPDITLMARPTIKARMRSVNLP
jgi:hypothetical protein